MNYICAALPIIVSNDPAFMSKLTSNLYNRLTEASIFWLILYHRSLTPSRGTLTRADSIGT
jgi:hypothetical protein